MKGLEVSEPRPGVVLGILTEVLSARACREIAGSGVTHLVLEVESEARGGLSRPATLERLDSVAVFWGVADGAEFASLDTIDDLAMRAKRLRGKLQLPAGGKLRSLEAPGRFLGEGILATVPQLTRIALVGLGSEGVLEDLGRLPSLEDLYVTARTKGLTNVPWGALSAAITMINLNGVRPVSFEGIEVLCGLENLYVNCGPSAAPGVPVSLEPPAACAKLKGLVLTGFPMTDKEAVQRPENLEHLRISDEP